MTSHTDDTDLCNEVASKGKKKPSKDFSFGNLFEFNVHEFYEFMGDPWISKKVNN